MTRHRYFDARGDEVDAAVATRGGVLLSGFSLRVPVQLRDGVPRQRFADARSYWDANRDSLLVCDPARLGGAEGCRPGFRILDNGLGRAAKESALADAEAYLTGAWCDADAGRRECPTCAGEGEVDGQTCERCQGTGELDDGDDDNDIDVASDHAADRALTADALQHRRDAAVAPDRNALIDEIANAWRGSNR
jgi:hypothetical protein